MIYRRAEQPDILTLIRMRLSFLAELHGPLTEKEKTEYTDAMDSYFRRCLGESSLCYLAEAGGACISTVFLCLYEKPASASAPSGKFGTIFNVYTCPEYRRQGHSTTLIRMAIEDGQARGLSNIDLMATPMGESVYRRLGFSDQQQHNKPMILKLRMEENG